MRVFARYLVPTFAAGVVAFMGIGGAFSLMNTANDGAVILGALLGVATLYAVWVLLFNTGLRAVRELRKHGVLLVLLAVAMAGSACSTRIEPGHVGIVVNYSGTDRGVQSYPAVTGRVWYNPYSESILSWPTYVQTAKWTASKDEGKPVDESLTFTNKDGMQFHADVSLSYHLDPSQVPAFYVKFRTDDMETFTHGYLRNVARDKFDTFGGRYTIDQIMGDNAEFITAVRRAVQDEVRLIGVEIDQFGLIGAPRPPQAIQQAINDKAEAEQIALRKVNEQRQVQAEAQKAIAKATGDAEATRIWSEAQAAANRRIADSLTPNLVEVKRIERWDSHLPQIVGNVNPFVSLK